MYSRTPVSRIGADLDQDAPATAPLKEVLQVIAPARQYRIFLTSTREGSQRSGSPGGVDVAERSEPTRGFPLRCIRLFGRLSRRSPLLSFYCVKVVRSKGYVTRYAFFKTLGIVDLHMTARHEFLELQDDLLVRNLGMGIRKCSHNLMGRTSRLAALI